MPRNTHPGQRHTAGTIDARREITLAVALPIAAAAATSAALWLAQFSSTPLPWWGQLLSFVAVAAPAATAITLSFQGPSRRNWKLALAFPLLIIAGTSSLSPAFGDFALAHHGVDVECVVTSRRDYVAHTDDGDEPMSEHEFRCTGWDSPTISTDRDEALQVGDHQIVVFDRLGRVSPDLGDPTWIDGLFYAALSLLFFTGAAAFRLCFIDDGTISGTLRSRFRFLAPHRGRAKEARGGDT